MATKTELTQAVKDAQAQLSAAQAALDAWETLPENNIFGSPDDAAALEDVLLGRASADCEGSYNCGSPEYTQECLIDGVLYVAKLTCEYNRHDKTYYYVEDSDFTIEPQQVEA